MGKSKKYKSSEFKVTHKAPANRWSLLSCLVSAVFFQTCLCDVRTCGRTYVRTDALRENYDHLFGRGLVGQGGRDPGWLSLLLVSSQKLERESRNLHSLFKKLKLIRKESQ